MRKFIAFIIVLEFLVRAFQTTFFILVGIPRPETFLDMEILEARINSSKPLSKPRSAENDYFLIFYLIEVRLFSHILSQKSNFIKLKPIHIRKELIRTYF